MKTRFEASQSRDRFMSAENSSSDAGWRAVPHACRYCGARVLVNDDVDGHAKCSNPECMAETYDAARGICFCGSFDEDDDFPIRFHCQPSPTNPDEIIAVEGPPPSAEPRARRRQPTRC
jgi:hypothetical protein